MEAGIDVIGIDRIGGEWQILNLAQGPEQEVRRFHSPTQVDLRLAIRSPRLQKLPFLSCEPTAEGMLLDIFPIRFVGVVQREICRKNETDRTFRNVRGRTKLCLSLEVWQIVDHFDTLGLEEVH